MTLETPPPRWSWAPRFPKSAIAAAALLYNTVAIVTILWRLNKQGTLELWPTPVELLDAIIVPSITANALAMFLQLNAELIHMILTMKANYEEKKEAVAKAKAEGIVEGQSQAEARFREWYESHQDELKDMPPPPFSSNGSNGHQP